MREATQLAQLTEKKKKGEDVRSKKVANRDKLEEGDESWTLLEALNKIRIMINFLVLAIMKYENTFYLNAL